MARNDLQYWFRGEKYSFYLLYRKRRIIVTVVNGENAPFSTVFNLANTAKVEPAGQMITLTSAFYTDDNSFAETKKVTPVVSEFSGFSNSFKMEFKPNSFTILRIKASR